MGLHRLTSVTIGVPDLDATTAYYDDFGLDTAAGRRVRHPRRRRATAPRARTHPPPGGDSASAPTTRTTSPASRRNLDTTRCSPRLRRRLAPSDRADHRCGGPCRSRTPHRAGPVPAPPYNGPGRFDAPTAARPASLRDEPVRPRKLGHVGHRHHRPGGHQRSSPTASASRSATTSRRLARSCAAPPTTTTCSCSRRRSHFLHHTSWQVDDIDEVGRGATAMLEKHPERHVWGLGRHHVGSNFFWYLKDPAGNFSEYYSDIDCILDDAAVDARASGRAHAGCTTGAHRRRRRSSPPRTSPALMTGAHSAG